MSWIFVSLPLLLLILASWSLSGLAIVRGLFRVTSGLAAFALALPVGMVFQLVIVNALAQLIFLPVTAWIVVIGALPVSLFCLSRPLPPVEWEIPARTRLVLLSLLLFLSLGVFYVNAREVWGDDPGHASMIQLMASGQFPLRFQCNPAFRASYGYGGDLLAAMAEIVGGITPWDAQDVVKAATATSVAMLAFLIGWRCKRRVGAGILSIFLIFTVATMLWLYLPLSVAGGRYLAEQSPALASLPSALDTMTSDPWQYSVVPPGFLTTSYSHSQRSLSWGFAPFSILLFLALLETPIARLTKSIALGIVLGTTALLHTAALAIMLPGLIGYVFLQVLTRHVAKRRFLLPEVDLNLIVILGIAFLFMAIQGGPITDTLLDKVNGLSNTTTSFTLSFINLPSCRGGTPTVNCVLLSVANMGLVPLLIPWLLWLAWRVYKQSTWIIALLGCIAAIGLTFVATYGYTDWNVLRLITFAAWTSAVLIGPVLYEHFRQSGMVGKILVSAALILISYTGVVEAVTIIDGRYIQDAVTQDFSPMVDPLESSLMHYGATLPLDARFFDPSGCSGVTAARPAYLFGRYSICAQSRSVYYSGTDTFTKLSQKPTADLLYSGGYTHLFIDSSWYHSLTPEAAYILRTDPLEVIGWAGDTENFRILMRLCAPSAGCVPYIPGIMEEWTPTRFTFGDSIQVTAFRRRFIAQDSTLHVDVAATALKVMSNDYHFSLRLTRDSDGKAFTVDNIADRPTMDWSIGGNYTVHDVMFKDVPPGKYHLSLRWYDFDTPDLHPLPVTDSTGKSIAQDAVLATSIEIPNQ